MRRLLSGLLVTAATTAAGFALSAHVTDVVAFDPGRPARVLAAMVSTDAGRDVAAGTVTDTVRAAVPGLSPQRATAVGDAVAHDPALPAALEAAAGVRGPAGQGALARAVTAAVSRADPAVGAALRRHLPAGAFVPSPVSTRASAARERLRLVARYATLAAAALAALALLVGSNRPWLLRRLGRWCLFAAGTQVLVWLVLPNYVLPHLAGPWPIVLACGLKAAGTDLLPTFLLVASTGAVLTGCAVLTDRGRRRARNPAFRVPARRRTRHLAPHAAPAVPAPWDSPATRATYPGGAPAPEPTPVDSSRWRP